MMLDRTVSAIVDRDHQGYGAAVDLAPTPSTGRRGPRWFCVASRGQQEHRALSELLAKGIEAYLPLHLHRPKGHPERERIVPLFSGYLFVRFDPFTDPWGAIRVTPGVWDLLMDGLRPLPLPVGAVEDLIARTSPRRIVDDPGVTPGFVYLAAGTRGRVADGPLAGWEGLCTQSSAGRVKLLLEMFGTAREVSIPSAMVVEAGA